MDNGKRYMDLFLWVVLGIIMGVAGYFIFLSGGGTPPVDIPPLDNESNIIIISGPEYSNIEITQITYAGCSECNSSAYLLEQIIDLAPGFMFNITSVSEVPHNSAEGLELIERYGITALPTLIISKNASSNITFSETWTSRVGTIEGDGAFVFRTLYPPFYGVENSTVHGFVDAYNIIPSDCANCVDLVAYLDYLESENVMVAFNSRTSLQEDDPEAIDMIERYNITKLPVFILSSDISYYPVYAEQMSVLMAEQDDGWIVLRDVVPPYVDLARNHSISGEVSIIKLVDSNCSECFNISILSESMTSAFGFYVSDEVTYEISSPEGAALLEQYGITKVPTVLVSPDASIYSGFEDAWLEGGDTIEDDGWFVFRSHEALGDLEYRDLTVSENEAMSGDSTTSTINTSVGGVVNGSITNSTN